jgi:hypothetical protein
LTDQHDPTATIESHKLKLFRQYKDPCILHTKFEPIFRRLKFLDDIPETSTLKQLEAHIGELVSFVKELEMGGFYGNRMAEILKKPVWTYVGSMWGPNHEMELEKQEDHRKYRQQIRDARTEIYFLAVEMLRYQDWKNSNFTKSSHHS